jgi:glycogen debranching enzyme
MVQHGGNGAHSLARERHEQFLVKHPDLKNMLFPGERIMAVEEVPIDRLGRPPSAIHALRRLVRAGPEQEIGSTGPAMAATTSSISPSGVSKHLRCFEALFGRDSLITARILLPWYPRLAATTLVRLAETQGVRAVLAREEEPGRIAHEIRCEDDPIAKELSLRLGWDWPYYGSIDATCLWLSLFTKLVHMKLLKAEQIVTRRDGQAVSLGQCAADSISWLVGRLKSTPKGLLESSPMFHGSIENQVWKDSRHSYSHHDGSLARTGTIASVETQGLAYDALCDAILLYRQLGLDECKRAPRLETLVERAKQIRRTVLRDLWRDTPGGGGFFALGSDRDDHGYFRQLAVRSSNMGHLLLSRVLDGDDEEVVRKRVSLVRALFRPDMICAAGLRTLSASEVRYRSSDYHNGASWPWDTYTVAEGLRRNGYDSLASDLHRRVWHVYKEYGGFPEFARGNWGTVPRFNNRVVSVVDKFGCEYGIERPPQQVQAWTVASIIAIKRQRRANSRVETKSTSAFEMELLAEVTEPGH